jgi:hypothetical protein
MWFFNGVEIKTGLFNLKNILYLYMSKRLSVNPLYIPSCVLHTLYNYILKTNLNKKDQCQLAFSNRVCNLGFYIDMIIISKINTNPI